CDAALTNASEPFAFQRHLAGSSLSLRISRSTLLPLVPDVNAALMQPVRARTDVLLFLNGYANLLFTDDKLTSADLRNTAYCQIGDLVALLFGANGEGMRGPLHAAKTYIIENSTVPGLLQTDVASHLKISRSQLQRLFQDEGTTFSAFLLDYRLSRVYRML